MFWVTLPSQITKPKRKTIFCRPGCTNSLYVDMIFCPSAELESRHPSHRQPEGHFLPAARQHNNLNLT